MDSSIHGTFSMYTAPGLVKLICWWEDMAHWPKCGAPRGPNQGTPPIKKDRS